MAVKTTVGGEEFEEEGGYTVPTAPSAPRPSATNRAGIGLTGLLTLSEAPTGLSEQGKEYVKTLDARIKAMAAEHKLDVTSTQLASPAGIVLYECNNLIYPVIMHEAINLPSDTPDTAILRDAILTYRNRRPGAPTTRQISSTVIHPSDYNRVEIMACTIMNTFIYADQANSLTAEGLGGIKLSLDTSMSKVAELLNRWSPKTIPARAEFGITLSIVPNNYRPGSNRQVGFFEQYQSEMRDVAVATGYVEFLDFQKTHPVSGAKMYAPIVHISDIVSQIPSLQMTMVMICLFADLTFNNDAFWQSQFMQFSKDQPNIGNLLTDMSQQPAVPEFVENPARLNWFLNSFLAPPVLVVDIVDGMPRAPGIELFSMPDQSPHLVAEFEKLVGATLIPQGLATRVLYNEFLGIVPVGKDGKLADSRNLDYLTLMVNFNHEPNRVNPFLQRHEGPDSSKMRVQALQQFYPALQIMYNSSVICPNPDLLRQVQAILRDHVTIISSIAGNPATINLSSVVQEWDAYSRNRASFGANMGVGQPSTSFVKSLYSWT